MGDDDVDTEAVEEANRLVGPGAEHHRQPIFTSARAEHLHAVLDPRRPISVVDQCLGPAHARAGAGSEEKTVRHQRAKASLYSVWRSPDALPDMPQTETTPSVAETR